MNFENPGTPEPSPDVWKGDLKKFLREQGYEGDPEVEIFVEVVSARNSEGKGLVGIKKFDSMQEAIAFVEENPELILDKDQVTQIGSEAAVKVRYGDDVVNWAQSLEGEDADRFDNAFDEFMRN